MRSLSLLGHDRAAIERDRKLLNGVLEIFAVPCALVGGLRQSVALGGQSLLADPRGIYQLALSGERNGTQRQWPRQRSSRCRIIIFICTICLIEFVPPSPERS